MKAIVRKVLKWTRILCEDDNIHCSLGCQEYIGNGFNYGYCKLFEQQLKFNCLGVLRYEHCITEFNRSANEIINLTP